MKRSGKKGKKDIPKLGIFFSKSYVLFISLGVVDLGGGSKNCLLPFVLQ